MIYKSTFIKTILLCFSVISVYTLNAQTKGKNSGLDQPTYEILKARTTILANFNAKELNKVKIQRDSLRKIYDSDNHLPFFPAEYWLLCFWTKDYSNILSDKFLNDTSMYNSTYVSYPVFDNMGEEVRKITRQNIETIKGEIQTSNLSSSDKSLLEIVLIYSVHKTNEPKDVLQIQLNDIAKKFLETNSSSSANGMIRKYMIKEYIAAKGADEIIIGGGYVFPFDKLGDYFSEGYSLNIEYRRYIGCVFLAFSGNMFSGEVEKEFNVENTTMINGELFNNYYLGIDLGSRFLNNKAIAMSLNGGAGYDALNITHVTDVKDNTVEQIKINTVAVRAGFAIDFKFVKQGYYTQFKKYEDYNHFKFFRLKYEYQIPMFKDKAPDLTGALHSISLSIGFDTNKILKK